MKTKWIVLPIAFLIVAMPAMAALNGHGPGRKYRGYPLRCHSSRLHLRLNPYCSATNRSDPFHYSPWLNSGEPLLRDADGDGIPNGKDPDFTHQFTDADGDGHCDNLQIPSSAQCEGN